MLLSYGVHISSSNSQHRELADKIITYLKENNVVMKVEKDLPYISLRDAEIHDEVWSLSNFADSLQEFGRKSQQDMLKAGYTAVEPLITSTPTHKGETG